LAAFAAQRSTWYPFLFDEILSFQAQKRGVQSGLWWAKRVKCTVTPISPGSQDYKEQIPKGLSQQTMMGSTKVLDVTTGAWNWVAKIWKSKIFAILYWHCI
jgi:hypothetical protein